MKTRRFATLLATAGLSLTLIGAGLNATFTDSGSVGQQVTVGTFGIDLSSTTPGAVVSPDGTSITFTAPTILSSAASSAPLSFTVTSTGSIPAVIQISQSALAAPWSSLLVEPVADVTLSGVGQSHTYNAGLAWSELFPEHLGTMVSITYTIDAIEVAP